MTAGDPAYGAAERARLRTLAAQLAALNPDAVAGAPAVADILRELLPDVDDVTIGRVLLTVTGGPFTALWRTGGALPGLALVGLHLTETEWRT